MMRALPRLVAALALVVTLWSLMSWWSPSNASACAGSGGLTGVAVRCIRSGGETNDYIAGHSDHTYSIRPACGVGGTAAAKIIWLAKPVSAS